LSRTLRIADLVGSRIVDADGRRLGRVVDLELDARGGDVGALVLGRYAWLHRLHLGRLLKRGRTQGVKWSSVAEFERGEVRLKPGRHLDKG
jgi:sporulation protein YlmC with PRC-barrel domain